MDNQQHSPPRQVEDQDLLLLHPARQLLNNLDAEKQKMLRLHLSDPVVQSYFRLLANNSVTDVLKLKFERADDQLKLAARYNRFQGILEVCDMVTSEFGRTT